MQPPVTGGFRGGGRRRAAAAGGGGVSFVLFAGSFCIAAGSVGFYLRQVWESFLAAMCFLFCNCILFCAQVLHAVFENDFCYSRERGNRLRQQCIFFPAKVCMPRLKAILLIRESVSIAGVTHFICPQKNVHAILKATFIYSRERGHHRRHTFYFARRKFERYLQKHGFFIHANAKITAHTLPATKTPATAIRYNPATPGDCPPSRPTPMPTPAAPALLRQIEAATLGAPGENWRGFAFQLGEHACVAPLDTPLPARATNAPPPQRNADSAVRSDAHNMTHANAGANSQQQNAAAADAHNMTHADPGAPPADAHYMTPAQRARLQIAPLGKIHALPRCRHWVRGIMPARGAIYTLLDISDFFGFGKIDAANARLLLLPRLPPQNSVQNAGQDSGQTAGQTAFHCALWLGENLRLRAFPRGMPPADTADIPAPLQPCIRAAVQEGSRRLLLFDLATLAHSPQWLAVGQ